MSEMTITELERLSGRDHARERQENAEAMRLCDELEALDAERAADEIERLNAGYVDELTGYPLPGFESPRFVDAHRAAYARWISSEAGARTRQNMHPKLEERLGRERGAEVR